MTQSIGTVESYIEKFSQYEKLLNGSASTPLYALRREGIARFEKIGFPTRKVESWKYTNVKPITSIDFIPSALTNPGDVSLEDISEFLIPEAENSRIVLINGHYSTGLSNVEGSSGITVTNLSEAINDGNKELLNRIGTLANDDNDAFTALNTAFIKDGVFVQIADKRESETPIHILNVSVRNDTPSIGYSRNVITIGNHCNVTVVDSYVSTGDGEYVTNSLNEIFVGKNSRFNIYKIQEEGVDALHIGKTFIEQDRDSATKSQYITFGGKLVRNEVKTILNGENSEATLNGLYLINGEQHVDNQTRVIHAVPNCRSWQLYKGILDDKSSGVFDGRIEVKRDAQKTDAVQSNKNLLFSDKATVNSKPTLLIYADDVKCTHGATVGQLDEEQMFYLRSRGLNEHSARSILSYAFASDVIEQTTVNSLKERLEKLIHGWLPDEAPAPGDS
ncbi:MAG TPA: Fe-S cluster assembly protein SufD [bacterium]|jgi:Fe-S cluster assembly protein SufD